MLHQEKSLPFFLSIPVEECFGHMTKEVSDEMRPESGFLLFRVVCAEIACIVVVKLGNYTT